MVKTTTPDQRAARVAARRHGLITRAQALGCGLTDAQLCTRVRAGRWERLHHGVYRIGGAPATVEQTAYAAVLAAGLDARACGLSALSLLGVGVAPIVPTILVPANSSGRTPAAIVRRSPVAPADRTMVGPIPCTAPGRALLEAAPKVTQGVLDDLVDEVITRNLATPAAILGALRRSGVGHGREGAPGLRAALAPWLEGVRPGSAAEMRLIRRLEDWGFPPPVRQHRVELASARCVFVDLAWPDRLVGLEYDGEAFHTPRSLDADVVREEAVRALGWWLGRVDRQDLRPSSTRLRDELAPRLRAAAA
jgi:Transcriptional regulator, AbiEi antitoxin